MDNQRGFAMFSVFLLLLLALSLGAATMFFTLLDFRSTGHFATGNQALAASEAGIFDAINTINTRGVVNFQNDVISAGLIPTSSTAVSGYSNITYQLAVGTPSGGNTWIDGYITSSGYQSVLTAQRVVKVLLKRDKLQGGPGALHMSNDSGAGTFSGNAMTVDGNNYKVTALTQNSITVAPDPSISPHPAISTRNDTVTTQVISALSGQGTIIGLGSAPSVWTTSAASTADLLRFVNDIVGSNTCNGHNGQKDFMSGSIHCVNKTNGQDSFGWGTLANPLVSYVTDTTAKIAGGDAGAGVLIFSGAAAFNGNFTFCGWVLFMDPTADSLSAGGAVTIYGEVLTPLPAFSGNGNITIRYSDNCLGVADVASGGINGIGNLPHPMVIASWAEQ